MQKPIYAVSRSGQKNNRWFKKFFLILLIQIIILLAIWLFIKNKNNNNSNNIEEVISSPEQLSGPIINENNKEIDLKQIEIVNTAFLSNDYEYAFTLIQPLIKYEVEEIYDLLGKINLERLYSQNTLPNKIWYNVERGDSFDKIARKFNTTIALTKKINNRKTDIIRTGERLLVFQGTSIDGKNCFSINVSKSKNILDLMLNDKIFKRYKISTGKFGKTPEADFLILSKQKEPIWTRPSDNKIIKYGDDRNVLGTRWMAIKSEDNPEYVGFGIHGTWDRESIGFQSSEGCIRMFNEDVEELFDLVPYKTLVRIIN